MEVLYKRCCGIDIHKNMMVACIFTSVRKKEIRQFSTMTEDILQLVSWLKETDCEMAAMESTGSYWKPVYNIFEEEQIPIMVVNAQHIHSSGCLNIIITNCYIQHLSSTLFCIFLVSFTFFTRFLNRLHN